jgi:chromosome partitioning protein
MNQSRPLGRTVLSFIPKGGTGKTTMSAHLLVSAAKAGWTSLGIDFDPQGTLKRWAHDRSQHPNVTMLASFDIAQSKISDWQTAMDAAKNYDFTVFDFPPGIEGYETEIHDITEAVDLVLMPLRPAKYDWEIGMDWMKRFKERGLRKVRFVISQVPDERRLSFRRVQALLTSVGFLTPATIPLREDISTSTDMGLTAADIAEAKGGIEFEMLWHTVRHELGIPNGKEQGV